MAVIFFLVSEGIKKITTKPKKKMTGSTSKPGVPGSSSSGEDGQTSEVMTMTKSSRTPRLLSVILARPASSLDLDPGRRLSRSLGLFLLDGKVFVPLELSTVPGLAPLRLATKDDFSDLSAQFAVVEDTAFRVDHTLSLRQHVHCRCIQCLLLNSPMFSVFAFACFGFSVTHWTLTLFRSIRRLCY
jgi:hypothetical protein